MARLAVAVAGFAVGSAFGMPQLGFIAGSIAGNLLFPEKIKTNVTGPRLGDLSVSVSTYGQTIPIGFGTVRMGGNVIWATPIQEHRAVSKQSQGGKGGVQQTTTTTTYTYSASFALAFAEGPAEDVTRLWADGKLIYDKTTVGAMVHKSGLNFRFYPGSETQLPDVLITADKGPSPAYRGVVYIVFDNLALADFGNRIPNITAEIAFQATPSYPFSSYNIKSTEDGPVYALDTDIVHSAYDYRRKYLFGYVSSYPEDFDPQTFVLSRIAIPSMQEKSWVSMDDVWENTEVGPPVNVLDTQIILVDPESGYVVALYTDGVDSGNNGGLVRIDPITLRIIDGFPADLSTGLDDATDYTTTRFVPGYNICLVHVTDGASTKTFIICGTQFNSPDERTMAVGVLNLDGMAYVWGENQRTPLSIPVRGKGYLGSSDVIYIDFGGEENNNFYTLRKQNITFDARYEAGVSVGVSEIASFAVLDDAAFLAVGITSDLDSSNMGINSFNYDPDSDAIIGCLRIGPIFSEIWVAVSVDATTGVLNWATELPDTPDGLQFVDMSKTQRFVLKLLDAADTDRVSTIVSIDKYTGVILQTYPFTNWRLPSAGGFYPGDDDYDFQAAFAGITYDPDLNAYVIANASLIEQGVFPGLIYLDRTEGGSIALSDIVEDLSMRAGIDALDIDADELDDTTVRGFFIGRQTTVRDAIQPLASAFFFDAIESDYQVRYIDRGRASERTLVQTDLCNQNQDGNFWVSERGIDQELPLRVAVSYMDIGRDHQVGMQYARRASEPFPVMYSRNEQAVDLPIVLNGDEGKQIAEKTLFTAWLERDRYQAKLSWQHVDLEPGDVVTVELDSGATFKVRIGAADMGADFSTEIKAVGEETASYTSAAESQNDYVPSTIQGGDNETFLRVHNIPLLSDAHDQLRTKSVLYYQVGPLFDGADWRGCTVYKSTDNVNWSTVSRMNVPVVYGHVSGTLAAPENVFAVDEESTLTIWPISGGDELDSITYEELVAGAMNMMLVGDEVINFQNVTSNADGSYTLDTFLRGRRGTDVKAASHVAAEMWFLLSVETAEAFTITLGEIGTPLYFKAVGDGLTIEETSVVAMTPTGEDLKPYAPVLATREDSGSPTDITLSWERRTRINSVGLSGDAPLNEDTEAYEVDILSGTGGTVLRTLSSSTPSVLYAGANIISDFGSVPAVLYCRIYQISAQVDWGFSYEFALEAS